VSSPRFGTLRVTNVQEVKLPIQTARYIASLIRDAGSPWTDDGWCLDDLKEPVTSTYDAAVVEDTKEGS
jgi:hypothetical protein